jgi:adenosine deaminase
MHSMRAPVQRPLSDLHRHLDGSLRLATLVELARELGVEVRDDLWFHAGMGLDEALDRFRTTLAVLQTAAAVRRVAAEICEDAAAEGVATLEIRFAPQLHRGAGMERIVDAALDGIGGRAGLVLCALYGEPPELVDRFVELARSRPAVVGIDLAGGPGSGHRWSLRHYREPFARARSAGIGRTVHAGEGRPAEEIAVAVSELHAQRIGHGTTLLDDPWVVDLVLERRVVIEACPTSNVHTGAVASIDEHPLPRWLERGVAACVNTDNTLLSATTAPEEHARAAAIPGMSQTALDACIEVGHRAAFRR